VARPQVLLDQVLQHTETGAASTDEAVCIFGDVAVLAPRGRFEVEMHANFVTMFGQVRGVGG
jgi:structure-specific recognition protein 1